MRQSLRHRIRHKRFQAAAAVVVAIGAFAVVGAQSLFIGASDGPSFCEAVKDIPDFDPSSSPSDIAGELKDQKVAYTAIAKAAPDATSQRSAQTLATFYSNLGTNLAKDNPEGNKAAAEFILKSINDTKGIQAAMTNLEKTHEKQCGSADS